MSQIPLAGPSALRAALAGLALVAGASGCAYRAAPPPEVAIPLRDGLTLYAIVAPYDAAAHPYTTDDGALLDGRPFFGSDNDLPETVLEAASLEVGGRRVRLDVSGMTNPWFGEPDPSAFRAEPYGDHGDWLVRGLFSDGAGTYVAEWLVRGSGSVRTALTSDAAVMDVLMGDGPASEE